MKMKFDVILPLGVLVLLVYVSMQMIFPKVYDGVRLAPSYAAEAIVVMSAVPEAVPHDLLDKARSTPQRISMSDYKSALKFTIWRCDRSKVADESSHSAAIKKGCSVADGHWDTLAAAGEQ